MRKLILAVIIVLATATLLPAPSFAAKHVRSFNSCVQLALNRGFTYSDLYGGATKANLKRFIRNCQNGTQH